MTSTHTLKPQADAPGEAASDELRVIATPAVGDAPALQGIAAMAGLSTLRVAGLDAQSFLQGQLTNDVAGLAPERAQYFAYCSPKGRVLANGVMRRAGESSFELLLPGPLADAVRKRLTLFVLRSKLTLAIADQDIAWIGVGGGGARDAVTTLTGGGAPAELDAIVAGGLVALGLGGDRFLLGSPPSGVALLLGRSQSLLDGTVGDARAAWQLLTVRAGVPAIGPATQDLFVPQSLNWDALGGISFRKGCYTGQEIVARMQYLGRLKERLFLAHAPVSAPPPAGERIFSPAFEQQPCGTVIEAATAPGGSDLLAVLQVSAADTGDLHLGTPDGPALTLLPLPYALPPLQPPRGRMV